MATTGTSNVEAIDPIRVRLKAGRQLYARKNNGHVVKLERRGVDVKVWVSTRRAWARGRPRDARTSRASAGRGRASTCSPCGAWARSGTSAPTAATGSPRSRTGGLGRRQGRDLQTRRPAATTPSPTTWSRSARCSRRTASRSPRTPRWASPRPPRCTPRRLSLQVPRLGRARRQRRQRAGHREVDHRRDRRRRPEARLPHDLAGGRALRPHPHRRRQLRARSALGGGDGGAVGALEETGLDVKLIDWDAAYEPFTGGFGGLTRAASTAGRRT